MTKMRLVEKESDDRTDKLYKLIVSLWNLDDTDDCQDLAHAALGIISAVAIKWNPYWVVGLLRATEHNIFELMEEDDG